ncbi:MAG: winged helix-turn-helix transcriptional regulator [Flavobacteriales bacterium]|nr:winged helix-turn-helix transcriptional regulator [Flavobacteriales bacterium]MBP9081286.1 winged helix-turn-helix transcriptional regulator [Flavobacteriales bacterium]
MHRSTDEHLAQVLERLGEVARSMRWKQATDAGLSALQLRILGVIAAHPERAAGVATLAAELQVGKATVSESVKALVDQKFLHRKADSIDGRSHALHLRAAARKHVQAVPPLSEAVAALPDERKNALLLASMQLLAALVDSGEVQVQRMCWTCAHYRGDRDKRHHCALLKKKLAVQELRTDCAEHERAA